MLDAFWGFSNWDWENEKVSQKFLKKFMKDHQDHHPSWVRFIWIRLVFKSSEVYLEVPNLSWVSRSDPSDLSCDSSDGKWTFSFAGLLALWDELSADDSDSYQLSNETLLVGTFWSSFIWCRPVHGIQCIVSIGCPCELQKDAKLIHFDRV